MAFQNNEKEKRAAELAITKEKAEAANITKSQFLSNMAYEIRTPLNAIMGTMQLLDMTDLSEEQQDLIHISKTASDALLIVINGIHDYSKLEAGQLKLERVPFFLKDVLADTEKLFHLSLSEKKILFSTFIGSEVPNILIGDSFRLRQIISNLLGNATKFIKYVQITHSANLKEKSISNITKLHFSVEDTVIGISPEKFNLLFKSFSKVDSSNTRQYGGTGLGLAICKGLIEQMNGDIWLKSSVGQGSNFHFTCSFELPSNLTATKKLSAISTKYTSSKSAKILLVEDDIMNSKVISRYINKRG